MDENNNEESVDICGIDGRAEDHVTKGELNIFIRRIKVFHLRPMQSKIDAIHLAMFHPTRGLDNIRKWIIIAAAIGTTIVSGIIVLLTFFRHMGWVF